MIHVWRFAFGFSIGANSELIKFFMYISMIKFIIHIHYYGGILPVYHFSKTWILGFESQRF